MRQHIYLGKHDLFVYSFLPIFFSLCKTVFMLIFVYSYVKNALHNHSYSIICSNAIIYHLWKNYVKMLNNHWCISLNLSL